MGCFSLKACCHPWKLDSLGKVVSPEWINVNLSTCTFLVNFDNHTRFQVAKSGMVINLVKDVFSAEFKEGIRAEVEEDWLGDLEVHTPERTALLERSPPAIGSGAHQGGL